MNSAKLPLRNKPPEVRLIVSVALEKVRVPALVETRLSEFKLSVPPEKAAAVMVPVTAETLRFDVSVELTPARVPDDAWSYPAYPT